MPSNAFRLTTRGKLVTAFAVVVVVLGLLIRTAVIHASSYYLTVDELYKEGGQAVGQPATVSGNVVAASVKWDPVHEQLAFAIQDAKGRRALPVVFHGTKPDDFDRGWPVIVSGTLTRQGVFQAEQLLVKCPSKYQAQARTYMAKHT